LTGARLQSLLARLAVDAGRPVTAMSLADAIWDGAPPRDETHALQSLVSRLRRALGDGDAILPSADGYRLQIEPDDVDAGRFERLAAEGRAHLRDGDPQRARRVLAEALALWRDVPLTGLSAPAFAPVVARLTDLRVAAVCDRVQADFALGHAAEVVSELEVLADEHPLHERLVAQLMTALYAAGRQADALATYERVRARLSEELGVAPSPELQKAHLAVIHGTPPPPAPAAPPPSNGAGPALGPRLTSFVGRERELERVGELLTEQRLVTLIGAGGAGKTRLASELAERWGAQARGGVWMAALAPVADAVGIGPALLDAIGLRETQLLTSGKASPAGDAVAHAMEVLADRAALLVLDNCEHLIEAVAELAERLLSGCARLRILTTSREPLAITGETIVPVAPLALPDGGVSAAEALEVPAVRLFADRAAAASAGFAVDEDTVGDVVEICRRVDGLPLAIELAAARLRTMTLGQLADRLDDRFRLLTGGSRTAMARQRTLRAVVDWSWDLLADPERRMLSRLAVFPGGATLEAAEAVCAGGPVRDTDVFDLLSALVDKSLLQIDDAGGDGARYRMLETIREYGLDRAEETGELGDIREAHARHYLALARQADPNLRGPDQVAWQRRLDAEHANLLAALRHLGASGDTYAAYSMVVALLWFWLTSGSSRDEVLAWVEFARGLPGEADPLDRVMIEAVHGLANIMPGQPGEGDPLAMVANVLEQIADEDLTHHPLLAAVRPMLAVAVSRERMLELLALSESHPDPWVRATAPFVRVQIYENEGDTDALRDALDESVAAFREVGDRWGLGTTLTELAGLRIVEGDLDGAEDALEQSRSLMVELGGRNDNVMIGLRLADVRTRRGDNEGARAALAAELDAREHYPEENAMLRIGLAVLTYRAGDAAAARELAQEAMRESTPRRGHRPGQGHVRAVVLGAVGLLELFEGDREAAEPLLAESYAVALATEDMPIIATVGVAIAALATQMGLPVPAAEILGAAARLRGAEDATHPEVARLTVELRDALGDAGFAEAYGRGRALDRDGALSRLDPQRLA
jgi:predicted ATPase/DNA-binding SARP family transcriptional activator